MDSWLTQAAKVTAPVTSGPEDIFAEVWWLEKACAQSKDTKHDILGPSQQARWLEFCAPSGSERTA